MEKIWLKSYSEGVPETIDPDKYTSINAMFDECSEKYAERVGFTNFDVTMTYQELAAKSYALAGYLQQKLNLQKGDRVAIMMPNLLQYPVCVFGVLLAGLTAVNVNPLYTPRELKHQMRDSGAKAIIILENFANTLEQVLDETDIEHVIVTNLGDMLGGFKGAIFNFVSRKIKKMVPAWNIPNALEFKKILEEGNGIKLDPVDVNGDDLAFLQYTGGTTGVAKGAMLTHRNMIANILQVKACMAPMTQGMEVVVGALPFYHIFALTACCMGFMATGGNCLMITNPRDLKMFIAILAKTPATIFMGLNTLFSALARHPDIGKADFSKLHLTVGGGMSTQAAVAKEWEQVTGCTIAEGYGLTEASPVVTMNPVDQKAFSGSAGLPVSSTDVCIRDESGQELPVGEAGELWLKGPQVMKGYWQREDATREVMDDNGWLRTGDVARVDDKGFVYIVDRLKDMILVSGFNVYPNEVEEVLVSHQDVLEAAVIGVPHEKTGEAIKAFIVKNDPNLSDSDVIGFCRENLTGYKIPKIIEFRDELPKSNVGKVLRRELRE